MHFSKKYHQLSDEELIHRYRNTGNNEWLGHLLERYTALLFGVAMKYLKDSTQAEDAVQQVFLKILGAFPKENIMNFKGWLYVLMRNHCLHQIRDDKHLLGDEALAYITDTATDNVEELTDLYTTQNLNEAIVMLNEEQRICIVLFYLKKYSYEQIIQATGYTFMQVKSCVQNGKRNLKNILIKMNK